MPGILFSVRTNEYLCIPVELVLFNINLFDFNPNLKSIQFQVRRKHVSHATEHEKIKRQNLGFCFGNWEFGNLGSADKNRKTVRILN